MGTPNLRHRPAAIALATLAIMTCMDVATASQMRIPMSPPRSQQIIVLNKSVRVESAWVRAAPPGATMLAGYMDLHNDGKTPQRFISAQSDVFGMVELHKTMIVNGVSTMRPAGDQSIPAGGDLRFEPGGLHLMLMQPKRVLKIGDSVRFRLHFADGSVMDVIAVVSAEAPAVTTH